MTCFQLLKDGINGVSGLTPGETVIGSVIPNRFLLTEAAVA